MLRKVLLLGVMAGVMTMGAADDAFAWTASVKAIAVVSGGVTNISVQICPCFSASEINQIKDAAGGNQNPVTMVFTVGPGGIRAVENDPVDDDETSATVDAGAYSTLPFTTQSLSPCPPTMPSICINCQVTVQCPVDEWDGGGDDAYNHDFQWGDANGDEGEVPPGTKIDVPGLDPIDGTDINFPEHVVSN